SEGGYIELAHRAEKDERLPENFGERQEKTQQLLPDLVSKATESVVSRLLAVVPPEGRAAIQQVLFSVSDKVLRNAGAPRDFSHATALVDKLQGTGQLNETAIIGFADGGQYEETVV